MARPQTQFPFATDVLFVTSEMADFLKAGGLGEISAYLPRALRDQGHRVRVLLPGYRAMLAKAGDVEIVADLPGLAAIPACQLGLARTHDGLEVYFILCPDLYDRPGSPYTDPDGQDWADNDIRFARLGLAAAEIAGGVAALGWRPALVHANDWPSGLAPAYLAWRGVGVPTILTIHNLAYQGLFPAGRLGALGIPESAFQPEGVEFYGHLSFLKAGLHYAGHLTTVSPTYAREIVRPELGCGLDGLLRHRAARGELTGIINGIDESYDPGRDPHLDFHFDTANPAGKRFNAMSVRASFGLDDRPGPLFALVSRLVHQKGVDLVVAAADAIIAGGGQVVVNGAGEKALEEALLGLAAAHPLSVGVQIGFEETLARRMYAGSDFLLMPSRFEPCGLSQMYAQRFGSLPIARKTGGLADTIQDSVTGFLFESVSANGLRGAIERAMQAFRFRPLIERMKVAAMRRPAGWTSAAMSYDAVYQRALAHAPA